MTDKTELRKLIDDVSEIEKVAEEIKAARTENREPRENDRPIVTNWGNGTTTRPRSRGNWSDYSRALDAHIEREDPDETHHQ